VKVLINYLDCLREGLLKQIRPSKYNAERSIEKARKMLKEAKENFKNKCYGSAVIMAYLSMLNAAKAVLWKDGFKERSHICVARYLEEKYVKRKKLDMSFISLFERFRHLRHEEQYELSYFATETDAKEILIYAPKFIKEMERLIKQ